jgi:hypothetical protein
MISAASSAISESFVHLVGRFLTLAVAVAETAGSERGVTRILRAKDHWNRRHIK